MKKLANVPKSILGCFPNIPLEDYHKNMKHAFSKSDLDAFALSASNLQQKREGLDIKTDSYDFGRAFHARIEHYNDEGKYLSMVAVPPSCDKRSNENKKLHADFDRDNANKLIIDQKEWDSLENMLKNLKAHPDGNALLEAEGIAEETFIWQDKESGVICKCRPDKRILKAPSGLPDHMIIDWKTTASTSLYDLSRDMLDYRYHVQAAFYLDGIRECLGHDVGPFVHVFIEKSVRFRTYAIPLPDRAIEKGRKIYKAELAKIAECQKDKIWPGFIDLDLPEYAYKDGV